MIIIGKTRKLNYDINKDRYLDTKNKMYLQYDRKLADTIGL